MTTLILFAQLSVAPVMEVVASGPPLSPAEAAATLRRASPDRDLSGGLYPLDALPVVLNLPSRPAKEDDGRNWISEFDLRQARLRRSENRFGRPTYWQPSGRYREHGVENKEALEDRPRPRRDREPRGASSRSH
jgi:hypothetical protein